MESNKNEIHWLINANSATGDDRRIELVATDLIFGGIDNVFVYPRLDIERFKDALSRTLSFWPILTGRILIENDKYFIEFSDNAIPLSYVENDELNEWPILPVVIDEPKKLQPFIDSIKYEPEKESLIRLKLTRLNRTNEMILGTSFIHVVGDANTNLHFLNDLSQIYQNLQPILPRPTFERHKLHEEDLEFSSSYLMKQYRIADYKQSVLSRLIEEYNQTVPINLYFSSNQIHQLHLFIGQNNRITKHDALCSYLIFALNNYFFNKSDQIIRRIYILINFRGVDSSVAPHGQAANSIIQLLTKDFSNCYSISSIAETIRESIELSRNKDFLRRYISTVDVLMRQMSQEGRTNFVWESDEVCFNSNYKYDWANQVHLGFHNQCRFHTAALYKSYFRIFRSNPIKNIDGNWTRDDGAAEIGFRIEKGEKQELFLKSIQNDIQQHFSNLK